MNRLLPMLVGLKLEKLTLVPPKLAIRRNTPMNSVLDSRGRPPWATSMGGMGACGCCIGHWWLQSTTISPQGKNHGATRWNWSSGLQTWTLPRVPIHFPGIWGSQRYVSNLQHVGVPMQSGVPFFCNTESFKRRNHSRLPHHPLHLAA